MVITKKIGIILLILIISIGILLCFIGCDTKSPKIYTFAFSEEQNSIIETDGTIGSLPTPTREDNATFLGWYYNVSFSSEFKVNEGDEITETTDIYARWSTPYYFSLRYNAQGFCGTVDSYGDYLYKIPSGLYEITFAGVNGAEVGHLEIYERDPLSVYGYYLSRTITFNETGDDKTIDITYGQAVKISDNAYFGFEDQMAKSAYTSLERAASPDEPQAYAIALGVVAGLLLLCAPVIIREKTIINDRISNSIVRYARGYDVCKICDIAKELGVEEKAITKRIRWGLLEKKLPAFAVSKDGGKIKYIYRKDGGDTAVSYSDKTTDNSFITSKEFAFYTDKKGNLMAGIRIDDVNKQVAFIKNGAVSRTVSYRDILGYDVSEENNTEQKISGRAGRTIAGGLLFGPLGALAGSAGSRKVKNIYTITTCRVTIQLKDISNPAEHYTMSPTIAQELCAVLENILHQSDQESQSPLATVNSADIADKLKQLNILYQENLITEQEYNDKKAELLKNI